MSESPVEYWNTPLPKGMRLPEAPLEVQGSLVLEPLTHVDVNYSALLREALQLVPDVYFKVLAMDISEPDGSPPVIRLKLEVLPREE